VVDFWWLNRVSRSIHSTLLLEASVSTSDPLMDTFPPTLLIKTHEAANKIKAVEAIRTHYTTSSLVSAFGSREAESSTITVQGQEVVVVEEKVSWLPCPLNNSSSPDISRCNADAITYALNDALPMNPVYDYNYALVYL